MLHRILVLSLIYSLTHSAQARADAVRVEGGPGSTAVKRQINAALTQAGGAAQVCFKRKAPASISVSVKVAPNGQVTSARQDTDGPVAQCMAGILAVSSLPATGRRYSLRATFDTSKFSGGSIKDALARVQSDLRSCQRRQKSGKATVEFVIHPDGRVTDPQVRNSTVSDAEAGCLRKTMARARLGRGVTAKKVRYSLQIRFPEGGSASGADVADRVATMPDDLRPQKDGPLSGAEIQKVMRRVRDKVNQCYARELKKNRNLAGKVVLRFTIRDDGTVRNVKIKETQLGNARVEKCIVKVGQKLRFPNSSGATRVFYPFLFSGR